MHAHTIAETFATWLTANRGGVPAGHGIRAMTSTAAKEKPLSAVICSQSARLHRKLHRFDLTLRTEFLPDNEQTAGATPGHHQTLLDQLTANFAALRHALAQESLLLRVMVQTAATTEPLEERARVLVQEWTLTVQTAL